MAELWRLRPGLQLVWREWEGERIAYDTQSGDTHRLAPFTVHLLACLTEHPQRVDALAAQLQAVTATADDPDLQPRIATMLSELRRLHLVERVSP